MHVASRKVIPYVPASSNECSSVRWLVWNRTPSDHVPRKGGVPVKLALTSARLQFCDTSVRAATGDAEQWIAAGMTRSDLVLSRAQAPRTIVTFTRTSPSGPE